MALRRLLSDKGFSFSEELDLGLLDKQVSTRVQAPATLLCRGGVMLTHWLHAHMHIITAHATQFRRPFALAETLPPPKGKKRRKALDPFDDDEDKDAEVDALSSKHKSEAARELEEQSREERVREALQWDSDFQIRREGAGRVSNALLREQFVTDAKSAYAAIQDRTWQKRREMEHHGVLGSRFNDVRAAATRRVHAHRQTDTHTVYLYL